jgi:phosphoglycerate kinase
MTINEIKNSTVILRVCYDLPDLKSLQRVHDSVASIALLLKNNNKVILTSHWGRPSSSNLGAYNFKNALSSIQNVLFAGFEKLENSEPHNFTPTNIVFVDQTLDFERAEAKIKETISNTNSNLILLQNTRFLDDENSKDYEKRFVLAQKYSRLAKYFVDDAFAVSHRQEATNYELSKILPSCFGLSYLKEIENLDYLKNHPKKPFVVLMGGAKLETKLPLIKKILPKVDNLILGGALCFTFLKVKGIKIGQSPVEVDFFEQARDILNEYGDKLILPSDFVWDAQKQIAVDAGQESISKFESILKSAKTVFWNGPLGKYEDGFTKATLDIAKSLAELPDCFTVLGGGDTYTSLDSDLLDRYNFISMGGGATLEYLSQ